MEERLQKILSAAGICSRRASEAYLTAARVTVNGEAAQLGQRADPETDVICVDGVPVIDRVSEVPGLILACAFTGHGFGICPAVGLTVSELVQGKATTVPIDHLKYDRFKANG